MATPSPVRPPRPYSGLRSLVTRWVIAALSISIPVVAPLRSQQSVPAPLRPTEIVGGHEAAAGEVIVRFRSTARVAEIDALVDTAEVTSLPMGIRLLRSRTLGTADLIAALSGRSDVIYAEPNYLIRATDTIPNDPLFPEQWFLFNPQANGVDVHAPAAWDVNLGSGGHVIGVVDTGIDHAHVDLAANLWSAPAPYTLFFNDGQTRMDCPAGSHGFDAVLRNCDTFGDPHGHGTSMAGVIGARGGNGTGVTGVNWRARIMDLRFIGPNGFGSTADLITVLDVALQLKQIFGVAADLRVLSNSYATSGDSQAIESMVARTNEAGVLFVASAGNDARNNDVEPTYPASFNLPNIIAVAATGQNDELSSFSSYGSTTVHVGAPGEGILTTATGSGYRRSRGTSPAAAVVSGVTGLILSQCNLTAQELKSLVLQTVDPVAALGGRTISGGRVNADRAIRQCAAGNQAPRVTITTPTHQSRFAAPATVVVTVDAGDADGQVTKVDFYVNGAYLGTDTTAPHSIEWSGVAAGAYSLTAVGADNQGATGSSTAEVQIFVDPPAALPPAWATADVGNTGAPGTARFSNGVFSVQGAGADVWGTSDAFRYVYQTLEGDATIVARLTSLESVHAWTKAGAMIRETLAPSSAHAFMVVSAAHGVAFQRRREAGGVSTHTGGGAGVAPRWVKLARAGQTITASLSTDGASWTVVGQDTFTMSPTLYVGLAVSSHDPARVAHATFDQVTITSGAPDLPEGWDHRDIGAVGVSGSARESPGTFTVIGGGADVWGTADALHYASIPLSGDGTIVARVASVENLAAWTKAGVMIRETVASSSAHAFMLVSAGSGVAFQRRRVAGGASTHTGSSGAAPRWVRLARAGQTITASVSTDGSSWTVVGQDTFSMSSNVFVGLAVSSHDATRLATATFDAVTITSGAPDLPAGWAHRDVGTIGVPGSARETAGAFTVTGAGADIWGSADAFHYAHTPLNGDGTIVARLASVDNVAAWTKAGVMVRETLAPSSAHAFMLVSAGRGIAFQRRRVAGGVSTSTGGSGAAPRWVRLARAGQTITASVSTDGSSWTVVGQDTFSMSANVFVGLAVSSHDSTRLARAVFDQVSIAEAASPPAGP
jgi:regulation of enolase protein 1 (concanavalin A-like superfamily)